MQKPRIIAPGLLGLNSEYDTACQTTSILNR